MHIKSEGMPTAQAQIDALGTAIIEIAEGRVLEWREGDKHGEFLNPKDLAAAMVNVQKVDITATEEADDSEFGCGVSFAI